MNRHEIESLVIQRLTAAKQSIVAKEMGSSAAQLSRLKNDSLNEFAALLEALDLKLVDSSDVVVPQEDLDTLMGLARKGANLWLG